MTRPLTSHVSQLNWAADAARHAPSIFNTQPWRWRVGDDALELWADRTRSLDVVDPDGRLMTISCGVALHHARTALAAGGDDVRVERLPDPAQPDLLARIRVTAAVRPGTDRDQARFAAITLRHTDRRPFTDEPVDPSLLTRLRDAAEAEGAHLQVLGSEDIGVLAAAAARAAEVELADPAYRAQLRAWTDGPRWLGDGVPAGTTAEAARRRVPLRAFHLDAEGDADDTGDTDRGAAYAIVWGDDDEPLSWLRAGEALSAVMLDCTAEGLALSPMSDIIEVESTRETVRGLIARLGQPYLAIRIGHPQPTRPGSSPRRPHSEVIQDAAAPARGDGDHGDEAEEL